MNKIDYEAVGVFGYMCGKFQDANILIGYQQKEMYKHNTATQKEFKKIADFYLRKMGAIIPGGN